MSYSEHNHPGVFITIGMVALGLCISSASAQTDVYTQDFDDGWTESPFGQILTIVNEGWTVKDGQIRDDFFWSPPASSPRAAWLDDLVDDDGAPGLPYIQSPLLTNGLGLVTLKSYCRDLGPQVFSIATSTDGVTWTTNAILTNTINKAWVTLNATVDVYEPVYLRMTKIDDSNVNNRFLGFDDIELSLPPSSIAISDVSIDPTAPVITFPTKLEATITPVDGATGINAAAYYSSDAGASFGSVNLLPGLSNRYETAFPGLPSQFVPGQVVDYYIEASFNSQDNTTRTNWWPTGAPGTTTDYLVDWRTTDVFSNTNYSGFALVNGLIYQGFGWFNSLVEGGDTPALQSPTAYANGVGVILLEARNNLSTNPITIEVQLSSDGSTWEPAVATFTNTSLDFAERSVVVNHYEPAYVRIIKTGDDGTPFHHFVIDSFAVTEPASYVVFTNLTVVPDPIQAGAEADIAVMIEPFAGANNVLARLYYSSDPGESRPFASSMTMEVLGNNEFQTLDPIPTPDTPGAIFRFYLQAQFQGVSPATPAYDPPTGAYEYMLRAREPEATFTNLIVAGSATTDLMLADDYYWIGAVAAGSPLPNPATFYFDAGTQTWGDADQPVSITPITGSAESSATVIANESLSTAVRFTFEDTPSNKTYSVAEALYQNFDTWPGDDTFGSHSYDGWILDTARLNTTAANETDRALNGRYAILKYGEGTSQKLLSPSFSLGIGSVAMWYRNWNSNGNPAASFIIQKGTTSSGPWVTVAEVTNVLSPDWLFLRVTVADLSARYVQIVNVTTTTDSTLCIDELIIAEPGASVALGNPQRSPSGTLLLGDEADISVDATPAGGATNLACTVHYRSGTTAPFTALAMTNSGNTFSIALPPGPAGTVQYYFECTYEGFEPAPALLPAQGAASPYEFQVSTSLPAARQQRFDTWTETQFGQIETSTNEEWIIHDCTIRSSNFWIPPYSLPHSCWLDDLDDDDGDPGNPWVESPYIANGIGSITVMSRGRLEGPQVMTIDRWPNGGAGWETLLTITNAANDTWQTNSIYLNDYTDGRIRFYKVDDLNKPAQYLGLDNILITYPPSDAYIDQVYHDPAYPAQSESVTVYCRVNQINPNYPAFGFEPKIVSRPIGGSWQTNSMSLVSGDLYAGTVPPTDPALIQYFVRCDFNGVYYEEPGYTENRSPAFAPEAEHTEGEPTTFYSYNVRYFRSDYGDISVTGNFETVGSELIGNDWWEGAFYTDPTNQLIIGLHGIGYAENSQQSPGTTSWGDSGQWLTTLPTAGTLDLGGSNIVINGEFDGRYLIRFDLRTGDYMILRADWQDFDEWPMHATLFTEGSQGRKAQSWQQTFNAWDLSSDTSYDTLFENNWTNSQYRIFGLHGEDLWVIKNARIVNSNNHRAELTPTANSGLIYPGIATLPFAVGSGSMRFSYRVTDTVPRATAYAEGNNWSNYTFTATIGSEGDNTDDGCYWSMLYRYTGPGDYYELRVTATNQTQLLMELVKHVGGTVSRLDISTPFTGSLNAAAAFKVWVNTSGSTIRHRGYYNNSEKVTKLNDSGGNSKGTIGFAAYDVNMAVDSVGVAEYGYAESFSATPVGWSTAGAWTHAAGFYSRVGRSGGDAISFGVFTCDRNEINDSHISWTQHQLFDNVTTLGYLPAEVATQRPETNLLTVVKHLDGNGSLRFDNMVVTAWRGEDAIYGSGDDTWIMKDGRVSGEAPLEGRNLELRASRAQYTTNYNQSLRSGLLETVGPVTFMYRTPAGSPAPEIDLRWAPEGASTLFTSVTNITLPVSENWRRYSYVLNVESNGYVELAHISADMDARLFLDNVTFFDYHENSTNSWIAYNALLTDQEPDKLYLADGQSGYLNYDDDSDTLYGRVFDGSPYIQTPYLRDGVGEISFWYRRWPVAGGLSNGVLVIEKSPDAVSWTPLATIEIDSDVYTYYVLPQYDKENHFVRFHNDFSEGVPDRICLDNILVASPIATDLVITNVWTIPAVPVYTNSVKLRAALSDYVLSPSNVQVRAYYHVGTNEWATWEEDLNDSLAMVLIDADTNALPPVYTYETVNSIASHPTDTVVQYLVRADFDGRVNATASSPNRFKDEFENPEVYEPVDYNETLGSGTNRNPYYVVFSCPPDSVWINELNVLRQTYPWGEREYVEVCGRALTDLAGWRLRIVDTTYAEKGNYLLPGGTVLGNETNGFGFWVLGDDVPEISPDMTFTNTAGNYGMHFPAAGGIELLRTMGARVHAISYETSFGLFGGQAMTNAGYQFVGQDLFGNDSSVAKQGTGHNQPSFGWSTTGQGYTPGGINAFQVLVGNPVAETTSILITDLWSDATTTWITFNATPVDRTLTSSDAWYSTNLLGPQWTKILDGGYSGSGGSYTQSFNVMTNVFYQIRVEDDQ